MIHVSPALTKFSLVGRDIRQAARTILIRLSSAYSDDSRTCSKSFQRGIYNTVLARVDSGAEGGWEPGLVRSTAEGVGGEPWGGWQFRVQVVELAHLCWNPAWFYHSAAWIRDQTPLGLTCKMKTVPVERAEATNMEATARSQSRGAGAVAILKVMAVGTG